MHRIILYVDWVETAELNIKELAKVVRGGARLILVKEGTLPEGFDGLSYVEAQKQCLRNHSR